MPKKARNKHNSKQKFLHKNKLWQNWDFVKKTRNRAKIRNIGASLLGIQDKPLWMTESQRCVKSCLLQAIGSPSSASASAPSPWRGLANFRSITRGSKRLRWLISSFTGSRLWGGEHSGVLIITEWNCWSYCSTFASDILRTCVLIIMDQMPLDYTCFRQI